MCTNIRIIVHIVGWLGFDCRAGRFEAVGDGGF